MTEVEEKEDGAELPDNPYGAFMEPVGVVLDW